MSDPLDEIISMSNDETISKKQIDDSGDDDSDDNDNNDDDNDDDNDDNDDNDSDEEKEKVNSKSGKKRRKEKKINKKQMRKELQKNKIRQIKIAMPYTVNTESSNRVIDYNKSEEITPKYKHIPKCKEIPFYEKKWFKTLTIILVTIACSLLVMFVSIKVYKHIEYKIKTDPLTDMQSNKKLNDDNDNDNEGVTTNFDDDMLKDFDRLTTSIKGGKTNKKKQPKRDSKGRFVKTK